MTKIEFFTEYKKLNSAFPDKYKLDQATLVKFFDVVSPLEVSFMKSFVQRCIRISDPLDLKKAAVGELKSIEEKKRTEVILNKVVTQSDDGLNKYLQSMNAESLLEAILKSRK